MRKLIILEEDWPTIDRRSCYFLKERGIEKLFFFVLFFNHKTLFYQTTTNFYTIYMIFIFTGIVSMVLKYFLRCFNKFFHHFDFFLVCQLWTFLSFSAILYFFRTLLKQRKKSIHGLKCVLKKQFQNTIQFQNDLSKGKVEFSDFQKNHFFLFHFPPIFFAISPIVSLFCHGLKRMAEKSLTLCSRHIGLRRLQLPVAFLVV